MKNLTIKKEKRGGSMDDILRRELSGEPISPGDQEFYKILDLINEALNLTAELNQLSYTDTKVPKIIEKLLGQKLDESTTLIPPFYTDFGKNIKIGKNCMVQQCCTFFDRGGITIGDHVFLAPKVNLVTLNHDLEPENRETTIAKPIIIEDYAWVGINSTILPGVTVGRNAVVAAGSVVTKNVVPNTIVAGNPARFLKKIDENTVVKV